MCAGHWSGAVPAGGWRCLWTSAALSAGKAWRLRHGFAPSGSEYGPLTDLPDWSFADGRPGVPWKGQIRRKEECEAMAVSVSGRPALPAQCERLALPAQCVCGTARA
ncbi:hypothetical protein FKM82_028823, partial [Ascaphus truei]